MRRVNQTATLFSNIRQKHHPHLLIFFEQDCSSFFIFHHDILVEWKSFPELLHQWVVIVTPDYMCHKPESFGGKSHSLQEHRYHEYTHTHTYTYIQRERERERCAPVCTINDCSTVKHHAFTIVSVLQL